MAGKQAKILSDDHIGELLLFATCTRNPARNRLIVLLSIKAGLRAAEIANLTWEMVLDASGGLASAIELRDWAAKNGSGRTIPLHGDLKAAIVTYQPALQPTGPIIQSQRGGKMRA